MTAAGGIAPTVSTSSQVGCDSVYRIRAGRRLRHAPDWACSEAHVVFDDASGDFWILTPTATALVRRLETGPARFDELLSGDLPQPVRSAAFLREILDGLVESDLLTA